MQAHGYEQVARCADRAVRARTDRTLGGLSHPVQAADLAPDAVGLTGGYGGDVAVYGAALSWKLPGPHAAFTENGFGAGYAYEVGMYVQHVSNADIKKPNDGLTYPTVVFRPVLR